MQHQQHEEPVPLIDELVDELPDGSQRRRCEAADVPPLPTQFSVEQANVLYAAVAHAHFALASLRGARIEFAPGCEPPLELALAEPGNRRFFLQLTLLGMALEAMGLDPAQPIPLPPVRQQLVC